MLKPIQDLLHVSTYQVDRVRLRIYDYIWMEVGDGHSGSQLLFSRLFGRVEKSVVHDAAFVMAVAKFGVWRLSSSPPRAESILQIRLGIVSVFILW